MIPAFQLSYSQFSDLELESDSDLNLTLAEERTIGLGDCAEWGIEDQRPTAKVVHRAVDAGDQQCVGQIERLAQELDVRLFLDVEAARQAEIKDVLFGSGEGVAIHQPNQPVLPARTIEAARATIATRHSGIESDTAK